MGTEAAQVPNDPTTGHVRTWDELRTNTSLFEPGEPFLVAGDLISGFKSPVEVDGFTDMLMQVISQYRQYYKPFDPAQAGLDRNGHKTYQGWRDGTKRLEEVVKPKNFYGKIVNISALMLDDAMASLPPAGWSDRTTLTEVRYAVFGSLHSTNLSVTGSVAKLVKVRNSVGSNGYSSIKTVSYKNLPADNADETAERLRTESIEIANALITDGLRRVFSAGLPTLGEKR